MNTQASDSGDSAEPQTEPQTDAQTDAQTEPQTQTEAQPEPQTAPAPEDQPAVVAAAATETDQLDLSATSLLGTMLGGAVPRALVRLRGGRIQTLRPGDRIQRATVQAIEAGALVLVENGTARRLILPGG